jgi:hypothetical protein
MFFVHNMTKIFHGLKPQHVLKFTLYHLPPQNAEW